MKQNILGKAIIVASSTLFSLALVSCGQPADETTPADNPVNETVSGHSDPVAGVPVEGEATVRLAGLAKDAASFKGPSGDLVIRLNDLDQAAQKAVPGLPSDVREMINGDLQSMRDAVDASDWSAAQEAAASIAEVLDQTK